jgi:pyruvate kinase
MHTRAADTDGEGPSIARGERHGCCAPQFLSGDHRSHGSSLRKKTGRTEEASAARCIFRPAGINDQVGSLEGARNSRDRTVRVDTRGSTGGEGRCIYIDYPWLIQDARPGDRILLDDGLIQLQVKTTSGDSIAATVFEGGVLKEHKGVNLPGMKVSAAFFTEKDRADLEFGISMGVDYVALSFVRSADDVKEIKAWMDARGVSVPLIAKIEKQEAIEDIDGILSEADGIMVARGDLGVEMPLEEVPVFQKMLIRKANDARKIVITATQMLDSMTRHSRPTRAETTDVANAVLDGTDALMLSAETSAGQYPFDSVEVMDRIISFTEERMGERVEAFSKPGRRAYPSIFPAPSPRQLPERPGDESTLYPRLHDDGFYSATHLEIQARHAHHSVVARPRGGEAHEAVPGRHPVPGQELSSTDRMIEEVDRFMVGAGFAKEGDVIVLVAGHPIAAKSKTNFMNCTG